MNQHLLLEVKGCSKSFPGVIAFQNVDFKLYAGEIHCVVGENGAGKTTFIKILSGALRPDHGTIVVEGDEYPYLTPDLAHHLGIQTIYQEISLAPELTVAENIFMGQEPVKRFGFVDYPRLREESKILLQNLKIELDVDMPVRALSVPERQSVQIARALAMEAKILILDEPTAAYTKNEINNLLSLVKELTETGVGVIYISHHLEEVFSIHDRITVLRDGIKVASHGKDEVTIEQIIREMIGRDASKFYTREKVDIDNTETIEFVDYSRDNIDHNASFMIRKGEILGFAGMVGSGRTELARMIFGAAHKSSGAVIIEGEEVQIKNPAQAIRQGFSLLTEDRQKSGLILDHSVKKNTSLVHMNHSNGFIINEREEATQVNHYIKLIDIKTPSISQRVRNLSGGNQQKVVLAKWLYANSKVIIFDEPTRGIDVGAKQEIYKLMVELSKQGKYIIMISSDMPEIIGMCDRVLVMREGQIVGEINRDNLTEENILSYSIGGTI